MICWVVLVRFSGSKVRVYVYVCMCVYVYTYRVLYMVFGGWKGVVKIMKNSGGSLCYKYIWFWVVMFCFKNF